MAEIATQTGEKESNPDMFTAIKSELTKEIEVQTDIKDVTQEFTPAPGDD